MAALWSCRPAALAVLLASVLGVLLCDGQEQDDRARKEFCKISLGGTLRTVVNAKPLASQRETVKCGSIMPPLKLLETGTSIINPQSTQQMAEFQSAKCAEGGIAPANCISPPAYYTQYSNVYSNITGYKNGVPILAPAGVQETTIMEVRTHMDKLLTWTSRIMPSVRAHIGKAYARVIIRSCSEASWIKHPEIQDSEEELGGGSRTNPSTGVEEQGVPSSNCYSPRFPASLEEFFHTIHDIAIKELDYDAYVAIVCLARLDVAAGIFEPKIGKEARKASASSTAEKRVRDAIEEFGDIVTGVSYEYFVGAVAVWMGIPLGHFYFPNNVTSRASLKMYRPNLACLLARYFPVSNEADGNFCAYTGNASSAACIRYPGSCFCGSKMTSVYLGNPTDRSKCPSLKQIKEDTSIGTIPLAETPDLTVALQCSGCVRAGCDTDRGAAPLKVIDTTSAASYTRAWPAYAAALLAIAVTSSVF